MFFIPGPKIYPAMMSIQIHDRGRPDFFMKMVRYGTFPSAPKYVIINLRINNFQANFPQ